MGPAGGAADVLSVLCSLAVILGFILAAGFGLRRWRPDGRPRLRNGEAQIRIVTARAVGWQSSLQIVEAEGQRFLIGASRAGITAIGRLDPPSLDAPRPDPSGDDFASLLQPRPRERASCAADR